MPCDLASKKLLCVPFFDSSTAHAGVEFSSLSVSAKYVWSVKRAIEAGLDPGARSSGRHQLVNPSDESNTERRRTSPVEYTSWMNAANFLDFLARVSAAPLAVLLSFLAAPTKISAHLIIFCLTPSTVLRRSYDQDVHSGGTATLGWI